MKKTLPNILVAIAFTMAALPLMSPGCRDNEMNVGYHYIPIPGFEEADYLTMLNSSNEEMQYNAICYFVERNNYDPYLTTDSLKGTTRYDTALLLYQKVYPLMDSKNTWISSSAIRFIGKFEYNRPAYSGYILKNNNPSLNVQLEIIMDLLNDTARNQDLLHKKINFLQQQPSWLLQSGSYLLMGEKDKLSLLQLYQLMQAYRDSREDHKKLLILDVLNNHMPDTVFSFLSGEWRVTKNIQIKNIISFNLSRANNQQQVMDWFDKHPDLLNEQLSSIIERLSDEKYNDISSKLIVMALENGWKPASIIQEKRENGYDYDGEPRLYIPLFLNKYNQSNADSIQPDRSAAFKRIENALLQYPSLKKEWLAFEKRWFRYPLPEDLINQHRKLTDFYLQQTGLLLKQYTIDTVVYTNFMNKLNNEAKALYRLTSRKKE